MMNNNDYVLVKIYEQDKLSYTAKGFMLKSDLEKYYNNEELGRIRLLDAEIEEKYCIVDFNNLKVVGIQLTTE